MFLLAFVILAVTISSVESGCAKETLKCTSNYLGSIERHLSDLEMFCPITKDYLKCVFSLRCPLSVYRKEMLIGKINQELSKHSVDCHFNIRNIMEVSTEKYSGDVEDLQQYHPLTELTQQSTRYISRFNSSCVLTPSHVVFVAGLLAAILLCHCCKRISVHNTY